MSWQLLLLLIFGPLLILMATGMPIAIAFLIINLFGVFLLFGGTVGLGQLILSMYSALATFTLLPIPLFIFMGELLLNSGIAMDMMNALEKWMGRVPGRLAVLAVAAGTVLAALTGNSMSSTAMLGSVLVPEMEKRGYKKAMSLGPIMASGGLAIMIPPSSLAVLLCVIGEISIGKILVVIPFAGLLLAVLLAAYIIIRCKLHPSIAPAYEVDHSPLPVKLLGTMKFVFPVGVILFLVVGLILLGIADPSESAATGTVGMIILIFLYRRMTWELIRKSIQGTVFITGMLFFIIAAATTFGQILAFSGATTGLNEFALGLPLPPLLIFVAMQIIILIMGCFMSVAAIMMITLPVFVPVIKNMGFDPIWFGAISLLNFELAMITPPFGLNLFVMKGVAPSNTTLEDVYRAAFPMIGVNLLAMALMTIFPKLVLWPLRLMD